MPQGGGTTAGRRRALSGSNEGGGRGSYVYTNVGGRQYARGQESPPSAARPTYIYNPATGRAAPTPYNPPAPRGYTGRGPSGRQVFHTYAGWQQVAAARAAHQAAISRANQSHRLLTSFGALSGAIQGLLGHPPPVGGNHADYQRAVSQVGGFLRTLGTPRGAAQAGRAVGTATNVGRGLARSIGTGAAFGYQANLGKPSGLAAIPGDILGAGRDVLGYLGSQVGNRSLLGGGPLGGRLESQTVRGVGNYLGQLGHAAEYPGGPLQERLLREHFGPNRPAQIAAAGSMAGNVAARAIRELTPKTQQGKQQIAGSGPLGLALALNPKAVEQTAKDIPNFYAGLPSLVYEPAAGAAEAITGHGTGRLAALWRGIKQNDPLGALLLRGDPGPATQHPIFALAEGRGLFAGGHRLVGTGGRAVGAARPGTLGEMGNAFAAGPEPTAITLNDLRGRGRPGRGRTVFTSERTFSRSPGVNVIQRRAEVGRLPGQRAMGHFSARLARPAEMRRAGVPERTIRARERVTRGLVKRADFVQDKGIVSERMGRRESAEAAMGGRAAPSIHLRRYFDDRATYNALEKTGVGPFIHEGMKPGELRADLQKELTRLTEVSREIPKGSQQEDANFRTRQILTEALSPKNKAALALLEKPYKGDSVGRGFRHLETAARYIGGVERGTVEEQGVMGEQRLKASRVPALIRHAGARAGEARDAYLTEHGQHLAVLSEAHGHAEAAHGRARASVQTAEAATHRLLQNAKEAAGRVDRTRTPREGVVPTKSRVAEGTARVKAKAVDDLAQALRAERRHERNAQAAVDRGEEATATRHKALAHEARGRAADAQTKLMDVMGRIEQGNGRGSRHYGRLIAEAIQREHELHDVASAHEFHMGNTRRDLEAHKAAMKRGKLERTHTPWMVDEHGQPIETAEQADRILRAKGVHTEAIAHISQLADQSAQSSFRGARADIKGKAEVGGKMRTGEATRLGIAPISHEDAIADERRNRTRLEAARTHQSVIENSVAAGPTFHLDEPKPGLSRTGDTLSHAKHKLQELLNEAAPRDEQNRVIGERPKIAGMPELVVRDLSHFTEKLNNLERRNQKLGLTDDPEVIDRELQAAYAKAMTEEPKQHDDGRYVITFKEAADEQAAHATASAGGDPGRAWSVLNQQFRKTVLLTSTRWLTGNAVELAFRLIFHGIGPRSWVTGRKLASIGKEMDEAKWNDILAGTSGEGAHFGYALRRSQTFNANPEFWTTKMGKQAVHAFQLWRHGKVSPGRALGMLWDLWGAGFGGANRWLEHQGDLAIMGAQARRDFRDLNNNVLGAIHLGRGALEDTVKGLYGTARQERYARRIDYVRGQYSRFSPAMRKLLNVAPFIPWYINALKFMAAMAPVIGKTPVRTAALVAEYSALQQQLEKQEHTLNPIGFKGKGFLAVGTVNVPGGHMPFGRYLPFGALDPSALQGQFLPQFSGFLGGFGGTDWTGNPLPDPSDPGQRIIAGVNSFVESLIPGIAILRRLQEGGGTSAATSTVVTPQVKVGGKVQAAPGFGGDLLSAADKIFNPAHVIPQAANQGRGGGSGKSKGTDWSGGGKSQKPQDWSGGGGNQKPQDWTTGQVSPHRRVLFAEAALGGRVAERARGSSGPPPSPDRTETRRAKGYSGYAFTGRHAPGGPDADPGFDPYWIQRYSNRDLRGVPEAQAFKRQVGMQAGSPGQQRAAAQVVRFRQMAARRKQQARSQHSIAPLFALGRALGQSPAGLVAGDLVANRTWAKLAPLFQRSQRDMPGVTFRNTGNRDLPAFAYTDKHGKRQIVVSPDSLRYLLSAGGRLRHEARGGLAGMLAHEFAHSQQGPGGVGHLQRDYRGMLLNTTAEGGAEAFRRAVAGLIGDPHPPVTSGPRANSYAPYQRSFGSDPRRALIWQFPHVKRRLGVR